MFLFFFFLQTERKRASARSLVERADQCLAERKVTRMSFFSLVVGGAVVVLVVEKNEEEEKGEDGGDFDPLTTCA